MYQNILVSIDPSHGERVAPMISAAKALGNSECRFICVYVVPEPPAAVSLVMPREVFRKIVSDAQESVEKLVDENALDATIEIMHGHPARMILEAASKFDADVIIIGSHRPGFEDYLLGSTAARVVRHARCSVLVQR